MLMGQTTVLSLAYLIYTILPVRSVEPCSVLLLTYLLTPLLIRYLPILLILVIDPLRAHVLCLWLPQPLGAHDDQQTKTPLESGRHHTPSVRFSWVGVWCRQFRHRR